MRPGGFPTSRSNTVVILVPCCTWKCLPTACSSGVGYSRDPWVLHVRTDEFSVRVTQIVSKISVSWTHNLPFGFLRYFWLSGMAVLSKEHKSAIFESPNFLKLSFSNIQGCSNFVECESFLESNSAVILGLFEENLEDSIDSRNFAVSGYLQLIWKYFGTHMYGLAVYAKEGLRFAWNLSLENSEYSCLCFWLAFIWCIIPFPSIDHHLHLCACFFDDISSNIDDVLSVNPSIYLSLEFLTSIIRAG